MSAAETMEEIIKIIDIIDTRKETMEEIMKIIDIIDTRKV